MGHQRRREQGAADPGGCDALQVVEGPARRPMGARLPAQHPARDRQEPAHPARGRRAAPGAPAGRAAAALGERPAVTDLVVKGGPIAPRRRRAQLNWLLTVLPAFPLVLLVLRLWYLSRQDLPTMLLLVQYTSPLGMISALFITLIWIVPAVILMLRALGGILLVSEPDDAGRSLLAVTALRMPDWVVLLATTLAAFTWQLLLLPTLGMLVVSILGVTAVLRFRTERWPMLWITVGVPVLVGLLVLIFVWPGIVSALR